MASEATTERLESKGDDTYHMTIDEDAGEVESKGTAPAIEEVTGDEEVKGGDAAAKATDSVFTFEPTAFVPKWQQDRELKEDMKKWNLDEACQFKRFRFHQRLTPKQLDAFLLDFFSSDAVRSSFQVMGAGKSFVPMSGKVRSVSHQKLPTNVLTMEFWDRCVEEGIVMESGSIRKCMEDVFEGVTIGDEFRGMFVNEDSEFVDVYDESEKQEFMYKVMKSLAVGGPLCQYDDKWDGYIKATKALYKDLLTVHKDPDTGDIRVSSLVLNVDGADMDTPLFPKDTMHNFCYLIVDVLKRQVTVWYMGFLPFW